VWKVLLFKYVRVYTELKQLLAIAYLEEADREFSQRQLTLPRRARREELRLYHETLTVCPQR